MKLHEAAPHGALEDWRFPGFYVGVLEKKWRAQFITIRTRDSHPGVSGGVG